MIDESQSESTDRSSFQQWCHDQTEHSTLLHMSSCRQMPNKPRTLYAQQLICVRGEVTVLYRKPGSIIIWSSQSRQSLRSRKDPYHCRPGQTASRREIAATSSKLQATPRPGNATPRGPRLAVCPSFPGVKLILHSSKMGRCIIRGARRIASEYEVWYLAKILRSRTGTCDASCPYDETQSGLPRPRQTCISGKLSFPQPLDRDTTACC